MIMMTDLKRVETVTVAYIVAVEMVKRDRNIEAAVEMVKRDKNIEVAVEMLKRDRNFVEFAVTVVVVEVAVTVVVVEVAVIVVVVEVAVIVDVVFVDVVVVDFLIFFLGVFVCFFRVSIAFSSLFRLLLSK